MTDKPGNEPKKDPEKDPKSTSKGDPPASKVKDGEKPKEKDSTDWKAKHDEQGFAVRAAQKINEDQLAKIKILEEKTADPKDTNTRIAGLEVKLARSEAVSQHGLTVEQASRLKGTPAEILDDAKYWAEQKPKDDDKIKKTTEPSNKEIIDAELALEKAKANGKTSPKTPTPKVDQTGSWLDRWKLADPRVRAEMDEQVKNGLVDPFTDIVTK